MRVIFYEMGPKIPEAMVGAYRLGVVNDGEKCEDFTYSKI